MIRTRVQGMGLLLSATILVCGVNAAAAASSDHTPAGGRLIGTNRNRTSSK